MREKKVYTGLPQPSQGALLPSITLTHMPPPPAKEITYATLGRMLHSSLRWRVLALLIKHDALPQPTIASLLGQKRSTMAKHLQSMASDGVIEYWHGRLYRIPEHFRVPGEQVLDFGCAVLRMDRVK